MLYGEERTAAIVRFADHCVHRAEELIAEHGIDCDYAPTGNVMAVVHPKQEKRLRRAAEVASKVGANVRFLEPEEMRARGLPPAFLCGALEGAGGTLDPGKLVLGLRRAALAAGVRIHEGTRVTQVARGPQPLASTAQGTLRAERVVMASNAWTREIGASGREDRPALRDALRDGTARRRTARGARRLAATRGRLHRARDTRELPAHGAAHDHRRLEGASLPLGRPAGRRTADRTRTARGPSRAPSATASRRSRGCRSRASGAAGSR